MMVKSLLNKIISRFGLPLSIGLDNAKLILETDENWPNLLPQVFLLWVRCIS